MNTSMAAYEFRTPISEVIAAQVCAKPGSLVDTTPGQTVVSIPAGCVLTATIYGGNGGWGGGSDHVSSQVKLLSDTPGGNTYTGGQPSDPGAIVLSW